MPRGEELREAGRGLRGRAGDRGLEGGRISRLVVERCTCQRVKGQI